jgi:alpha-mannosidase
MFGSLFEIKGSDQIIIDTIKLAEDDEGKGKQIILRVYEAYGGKSVGVLQRYKKKRLSGFQQI